MCRPPENILITLKTCKRCHRLLTYDNNSKELCPECVAKDKNDFELVREYIREHRNASILEVAQMTGVSSKIIIQFINDDRVQAI
ncbi:MAG TPA: hypothetical protein VHQ24_11210 [Lachnospiraceae bacterium]|nr:hypothetical protein [Lachnospiraceae bacterium]